MQIRRLSPSLQRYFKTLAINIIVVGCVLAVHVAIAPALGWSFSPQPCVSFSIALVVAYSMALFMFETIMSRRFWISILLSALFITFGLFLSLAISALVRL